MHIEIRKNGTFYLKDSTYNPQTKLPKNTSVYLGSNPLQAKIKLAALSSDLSLLAQIPDTYLYEVELAKAIKQLQTLKSIQSEGISKLIHEQLQTLVTAKEFLVKAKQGIVVPTVDCPGCRSKNANHCSHFKQTIKMGNGRTKEGILIHCPAYEAGKPKPTNGAIKLPRDFR